jgi:hypothetical protein
MTSAAFILNNIIEISYLFSSLDISVASKYIVHCK